jgi:two-component system, NarL family, nitrate/nitrite response regulator NarL
MTRVYVVAAVRLYREGLAALLPRRDDITIVGMAASWAEGASDALAARPDVVLLDMALTDGSSAIDEIVRSAEGIKVIALAVSESELDVIAYARAGVSGFVARDESLDQLVAAIESAARGQVVCSPRITAVLLRHVTTGSAPSSDARLTRREREIAALLDDGLSNKEIARRLCIELATVKNHVHNILEKLAVRSRFDVAGRNEPQVVRQSGSMV